MNIDPIAQAELLLLQNLSLTAEMHRLSDALVQSSGEYATQFLPTRYQRQQGALREWRCSSVSKAANAHRIEDPSLKHYLEDAQRAWYSFVQSRSDVQYLQRLRPHEGKAGPLRVLVLLGGGGLGDALMFSAFLSALHRKLSPCEITILFSSKVVEPLYRGNPTVACAVGGNWGEAERVTAASRWTGIYDLVVDIFCFLPRFLVCEKSRVDPDVHGVWLNENFRLNATIDRFSFNLGIAILDKIAQTHVFNLLNMFSGLNLDQREPLIFSPEVEAIASSSRFQLPPAYVTARDGCNPGDLAMARHLGSTRSTKQLSEQKWKEIAEIVTSLGIPIVQIGDKADSLIEGVQCDLRGNTSLSELCLVMKRGLLHLDTEGGLAHFARSLNVPAIVFFGTTSKAFFGYESALNLSSEKCGCCWYVNASWLGKCPRGTAGPICTESIDTAPVREYILRICSEKAGPRLHMLSCSLYQRMDDEELQECASLRNWLIRRARKRAEANAEASSALISISEADPDFDILDLRSIRKWELDLNTKTSGSAYNFPFATGSVDLLLVEEVFPDLTDVDRALHELARLVRRGGSIMLGLSLPEGSRQPSAPLVRSLESFVQDDGLEVCWPTPNQIAESVDAFRNMIGLCSSSPVRGQATWMCVELRRS